MSILDRLAEIVETTNSLNLTELGTGAEVRDSAYDLAESPLAPYVASALVSDEAARGDASDYIESLHAFAIGLSRQKSYLALRESVDLILGSTTVRRRIARPMHDSLLPSTDEIRDQPNLAALRLEVALDLARLEGLPRYQLLAILTSPSQDLPEEFTDRLSRLLGLAADTWTGADDSHSFTVALAALIRDNAEDAAFEAAVHLLRISLQSEAVEEVCDGVRAAMERFTSVALNEESREDAGSYAAACQAVLAFQAGDIDSLRAASLSAQHYAHHRSLLLHGMHSSYLRAAARESELAWCSLAWRIETAMNELQHDEFLDTWVAIDSVLDIYARDRLAFSTIGLMSVIQPSIENHIARSAAMLRQLERAVQIDKQLEHPRLDHAAYRLLELTHSARRRIETDGNRSDGRSQTTERTVLWALDDDALTLLDSGEVAAVTRAAELLRAGSLSGGSPTLNLVQNSLLTTLLSDLDKNPDFTQSARQNFSLLVQLTLRYLALVGDSAYPFTRALKKGERRPRESELQSSFSECLAMSELSGRVGMEQPNVGTGRADVIVTFDNAERYITEVKREVANATPANLEKKYLAQAFEYQSTNVGLGQLLVLDLTDHSSGTPHLRESMWVVHRGDAPHTTRQSLVVAVVRGNRPPPSALR